MERDLQLPEFETIRALLQLLVANAYNFYGAGNAVWLMGQYVRLFSIAQAQTGPKFMSITRNSLKIHGDMIWT